LRIFARKYQGKYVGSKKFGVGKPKPFFFQFFGPEDGEYDEGLAYFLV